MKVYDGIDSFQPPRDGIVLTVGNFDGVHRGHRQLIETARQRAAELGVPAVALTFEPHPRAVLAPHRAPPCLTTLSEKLALLGSLGLDATVVARSTPALLGKAAEQFLSELVASCRPRVIVEGPTFNFGRDRAGSVETLRKWAGQLGFAVIVIDELYSDELAARPAISSSAVRRALQEGRVGDANAMLGRPYRISGVVGGGEQRGTRLGFPTANLAEIPHLLPGAGVYAAVAQLADGALYLAAANIGPQPTFQQSESRVEAHLLDYSGRLRGQRLGLHMLARLRGQMRFAGAEQLAAQIRRDVEQARGLAGELGRLRAARLPPL